MKKWPHVGCVLGGLGRPVGAKQVPTASGTQDAQLELLQEGRPGAYVNGLLILLLPLFRAKMGSGGVSGNVL